MRDTLIVTSTREWTDFDTMLRWLKLMRRSIPRLVHGGASGADTMAGAIGKELGYQVEAYPVDELIDGPWPGAGPRRNERMVKENAQRAARACAFSFPNPPGAKTIVTPGTTNCVSWLLACGVVTILVVPGAVP